MLTFQEAFIVALAGGVVAAFITTFVKDWLDRRTSQKRWLLDRQARDAEEIVTGLERVARGLAQSHGLVMKEANDLRNHKRRPFDYDVFADRVNETFQTINNFEQQQNTWVYSDVRRLSAWFPKDEQIYLELRSLGERAMHKYDELYIMLSNLKTLRDEQSQYEGDTFDRAAINGAESFFAFSDSIGAVIADIEAYQRALIKDLRDQPSRLEIWLAPLWRYLKPVKSFVQKVGQRLMAWVDGD